MSKKAVQKAIENIKQAAERQAYNQVMHEGEERESQFFHVKRNADALELLGIAKSWATTFDALSDAYYATLYENVAFWQGVKARRHVVVTAADL